MSTGGLAVAVRHRTTAQLHRRFPLDLDVLSCHPPRARPPPPRTPAPGCDIMPWTTQRVWSKMRLSSSLPRSTPRSVLAREAPKRPGIDGLLRMNGGSAGGWGSRGTKAPASNKAPSREQHARHRRTGSRPIEGIHEAQGACAHTHDRGTRCNPLAIDPDPVARNCFGAACHASRMPSGASRMQRSALMPSLQQAHHDAFRRDAMGARGQSRRTDGTARRAFRGGGCGY